MWIYDSCSATDDVHKAPWKSRNTQTYIHTQTFMRISAKDIHSQHKCHAGIDGLFLHQQPTAILSSFFPLFSLHLLLNLFSVFPLISSASRGFLLIHYFLSTCVSRGLPCTGAPSLTSLELLNGYTFPFP